MECKNDISIIETLSILKNRIIKFNNKYDGAWLKLECFIDESDENIDVYAQNESEYETDDDGYVIPYTWMLATVSNYEGTVQESLDEALLRIDKFELTLKQ